MALEKDKELEVLLAGADEFVTPFASKHERAKALVTTEVIAMSEHPANAVRQKKDASIVRAAQAVKAGEADGLFRQALLEQCLLQLPLVLVASRV